jgi:hypothetical protein
MDVSGKNLVKFQLPHVDKVNQALLVATVTDGGVVETFSKTIPVVVGELIVCFISFVFIYTYKLFIIYLFRSSFFPKEASLWKECQMWFIFKHRCPMAIQQIYMDRFAKWKVLW